MTRPDLLVRLREAVAHHQAGRLAEAERLYRLVLQHQPDDPDANHLMATAALQTGRPDMAVAFAQRAAKASPRKADFHNTLGASLRKAGNLAGSVEACERAIALDPRMAAAYNNLGLAHADLGELELAAAAFSQAIRLSPSMAEAQFNLGSLEHRRGHHDLAVAHLREALRLRPKYPVAAARLGDVLMSVRRPEAAAQYYALAVRDRPFDASLHHRVAQANAANGNVGAARGSLAEAIRLAPEVGLYHRTLGVLAEQSGELDLAASSFRAALRCDPRDAEAHRQLAAVVRHARTDAELLAMQSLYDESDANASDRMLLGFGLGQSWEELEDYPKAFGFFGEANRIRRLSEPFSIGEATRQFAAIQSSFTAAYLSGRTASENRGERFVFIVGMPRSGTTLVEQILAGNADVFAAGELNLFREALFAETGVDAIEDAAAFVALGSKFDPATVARRYLESLPAASSTARLVTDKLPGNFRLLGAINLALPAARFVHVRRAPLETCLSIFKTYFSTGGHSYSHDLGELGAYFTLYRDLMAHWDVALPGKIFHLDYEALVGRPEETTRALFDHCGLDWTPEVLDFHMSPRVVKTASFAQVRRPIYTDSLALAARYGSLLDPLRTGLGLPPV